MVSELFFYQLALIALVWLCCMLHWVWPSDGGATSPTPSQPTPPLRRRSREPQPFPGLIHKPHCAACEQVAQDPEVLPPPAPPLITSRRGRPRQVDTAQHFCPNANCDYRGWVDWGNISANGHPSGGPWRQLYCSACERYFLETHGTPFHGKRVAPDLLVWAVGALAEGLGIRAVGRVFAVDPNTVLAWLLEVADHLKAFSQYFLRDVRVTQVQLQRGRGHPTPVPLASLGVGGDRSGHQAAPDHRCGRPHAGDGPRSGPSSRAGHGTRLCAVVPHLMLRTQ